MNCAREAARGGDGAEAALEGGDALLEAGDGGVGEAGVDVAVLLQREAGGGVRGVVEDEGARLVDRQGARARHRVGDVACVDCARAEAVLTICHAVTLPAAAPRLGARRNAPKRIRSNAVTVPDQAQVAQRRRFVDLTPLRDRPPSPGSGSARPSRASERSSRSSPSACRSTTSRRRRSPSPWSAASP